MSLRTWNIGAGVAICTLAGVSAPAFAGPDWVELGDAGSGVFTAQVPLRPIGVTRLGTISGRLGNAVIGEDFEDLYYINVLEPLEFTLTTGNADFDPVLYLFSLTVNNELFGRLANDNANGETNIPMLMSMSNDGTGVVITQPGDYVIAIAGAGRVPVSRTGPIFDIESPTEVSGPDGVGGLNPLEGWTGVGQTGSYRVELTSTDFPATPTPGAAGLMIPAGILLLRRRR